MKNRPRSRSLSGTPICRRRERDVLNHTSAPAMLTIRAVSTLGIVIATVMVLIVRAVRRVCRLGNVRDMRLSPQWLSEHRGQDVL